MHNCSVHITVQRKRKSWNSQRSATTLTQYKYVWSGKFFYVFFCKYSSRQWLRPVTLRLMNGFLRNFNLNSCQVICIAWTIIKLKTSITQRNFPKISDVYICQAVKSWAEWINSRSTLSIPKPTPGCIYIYVYIYIHWHNLLIIHDI